MSATTDRLAEIKEEMLALLNEAKHLVRGTSEADRAEGYWLAHLRTALDDEHDYFGGSMITMQDSIDALEDEEDDTPDPEACPTCGCKPGEGYTMGCEDCEATIEELS